MLLWVLPIIDRSRVAAVMVACEPVTSCMLRFCGEAATTFNVDTLLGEVKLCFVETAICFDHALFFLLFVALFLLLVA